MEGLIAHRGSVLVPRQDLKDLPTPEPTATHYPIPHWKVVETLAETLGFRRLAIVAEEYAVTPDGNRFFGVMTLDVEESGVRIAVGLRNSHDKSFALAMTVGRRVLICDNLAFYGDYAPVLKKHTKHVEIESVIAVAVDQMQRNFEPMRRQIDFFKGATLSDPRAKLIIYEAFFGGAVELPKHLGSVVHDLYFHPIYAEFEPRTLWSLENAFTSAVKELEPVPRLKAVGRLAPFLTEMPRIGQLLDASPIVDVTPPSQLAAMMA
jgi:hypothetical protein